MNFPASSRLMYSDMPTPSCHNTLIRSPCSPSARTHGYAMAYPRKQNISPPFGLRPSPCWTDRARLPVPQRMSVTPPAIQTFTPAGKAIIGG